MATDIKSADPAGGITIRKALNDRAWQIAISISAVALIAVYWRTFYWWWRAWWADESYYSHGILVPLMSAFIIYMNRRSIAKVPLKPSPLGLLVLVPAMGLHFVSYIGNSASMMGMAFPLVVMGTVMLIFGTKMTKHLFFPILFLFFMCVLPGFILTKLSFKIQMLSTDTAVEILKLLHYKVRQEGTIIYLSNIKVMVGTPCSGFRTLISLVAFAVYFAYMKEGPMWGRLTIVAMTAPLSWVANSVRITLIALWGQYFGQEAMMKFHDYSGYIVLLVAFVILWSFAKVVKCEKFKATLFS